MWTTLFPLALAASIWFSAANLAVQLEKDRSAMMAATHASYGKVASSSSTGSHLD